jgi:hypothetical protein
VPDDPRQIRSVAGQVWRYTKVIIKDNLPDLNKQPERAAEYAKETWSDVEDVKDRIVRHQALPVGLCGMPVRCRGKRWGVIIVDSMTAGAISAKKDDFYELMGRTLSKLLERT